MRAAAKSFYEITTTLADIGAREALSQRDYDSLERDLRLLRIGRPKVAAEIEIQLNVQRDRDNALRNWYYSERIQKRNTALIGTKRAAALPSGYEISAPYRATFETSR